ncbi:uncharacterized protein LOC104915860 isoform X1 [Meleagris gallopavo]|uniref:uncharacterized protein LOC104915860 isoform X1 n=1 Tax=Meleagris gallopavo TaxID=9103 RepID=UPI000549A3AC|nr:uncharacterized protein LOC104915860 isoform X1 [Meleagris gallopavo]
MRIGILFMISYLVNITASSGPELLVLQYPENASVLLNSTVWMLCVFEYPKQENEEPVVYWRKGPSCDNQQSLRSSSGAGRPHIHIMKDVFRGFSILKLSNVDKNDSNSYFCDVILTQKTHGKCGNGTKLTVHDFTCKDCVRSEPTWWCWFLLLGYTLFVTTVTIAFGIHYCCKKCKNDSRNTDSSAIQPSEWIYEKPSKPVNNGSNQEYEDMSLVRTFSHIERKVI